MIEQCATRRERVRELLQSLPPDCGVFPADELLDAVQIEQDGVVLHGRTWLLPQDLEDDDDAMGLLEYRKGMTPLTLPSLATPPPV